MSEGTAGETAEQRATRIAGNWLAAPISCDQLYREVLDALLAERAAERERCAKIADRLGREYAQLEQRAQLSTQGSLLHRADGCRHVAAAIRDTPSPITDKPGE